MSFTLTTKVGEELILLEPNCYKKELDCLFIKTNGGLYQIILDGKYTVYFRDQISLGSKKKYCIIEIERIKNNSNYIGVEKDLITTTIFPIVQTKGFLFSRIQRKIYSKNNKFVLKIDQNGILK